MTLTAAGLALALAAAAAADAAPVVRRGDVAFPLEVWGVVCRWHVGSAARSAREGWMLRETKDGGWSKVAAGRPVGRAPDGAWLRHGFVIHPRDWREPRLFLDGMPEGAAVFLNGTALAWAGVSATLHLGPELRTGTNLLVVVTPAGGATLFLAPRGQVTGVQRRTGRPRTVATLRTWKARAESIEPGIPESWIRSPDPSIWKLTARRPPDPGDRVLPPVAACWKAALEFPAMWRGRPVAAYLHALPGEPEVWLNGVRIAEAVRTPARIDLAGRLRFNGKDTLCLVYRSLPPPGAPGDGARGLVALRWDAVQAVPALPSGTPWRLLAPGGPGAAGASAAMAYAAEILSLSASPYEFRWSVADLTDPAPVSGPTILAGWSATGFRSSDLVASRDALLRRLDDPAGTAASTWIMTHPVVGANTKRVSPVTGRLMLHNKALRRIATERRIRFIPVLEVTRSALKRARRGPVQPEFVTEAGEWTPVGSFVTALAVLDALSLP